MSSEKYYHAKGQKDQAAKKGYTTPHNVLGGALNTNRQTKENVAYRDGWRNANKQAKKK